MQEYLQAKLGGEKVEIAEGTIFKENKEKVILEEVKQSFESPDIQLTDVVHLDQAARKRI